MTDIDIFTILIIDDNATNLYTLRSLIEEYTNAKVVEAPSGTIALEMLLENNANIDLIILDVQMPELDGFETAKLILQRKKTENIPIIFLTAAYKDQASIQQGFQLGAVDYLTKPINDFQLINRIKFYLNFIAKERLYNQKLRNKVKQRTAELLHANVELQKQILERQQAQLALAESKQQVIDILDSITDAFFALNNNWAFTYVNSRAKDLLQLDDNIVAKNIWESLPHLKDFFADSLKKAQLKGQFLEVTEFYEPWGKWFHWRIYPYWNGLSVYIQDVSENKQLEKLQQEALQRTELANQIKDEFLANISHELRTPLNVILGYAQLLNNRTHLATEKFNESIDAIQRSGEHLSLLINDILDFSKLEFQRMELSPSAFNLVKFIDNLVKVFSVQAQHKGLSFTYESLFSLPQIVHGDEKRLRQILVNLLGNAIKFTEKGGIRLTTNIHEGKIRFYIDDTGVGIAPEHIKTIFSSFNQPHQPHKHIPGVVGVGLGLAISYRFIEMMNGTLHVDSEVNKGTTFWFEVELPEVQAVLPSLQKTDFEDSEIRGFKGDNITILVVDDARENRHVLNFMLEPIGFTLLEAESGQQALEMAMKHRPKVIITDLVMPSIDGFELIRQLRREPMLQNSIIFAMSSSSIESTEEQLWNGFLSKPLVSKELLKLLENNLSIEWVYNTFAESTEKNTSDEQLTSSMSTSLILPSKVAEHLFHLAMIGDILEIEKEIDKLVAMDKQFTPFANQVLHLVKNFQSEEIRRLIEPFIRKESEDLK